MTNCTACAEEYLGYSHCSECHLSWAGHAECHCADCCRHFSGDSAFRAHRRDGECRDPSTLKDKHGNPRFVPVEKRSKLGVRFVWCRAKEFPGEGFRDESQKAGTKAAPWAKQEARSGLTVAPCHVHRPTLSQAEENSATPAVRVLSSPCVIPRTICSALAAMPGTSEPSASSWTSCSLVRSSASV